MIVGVYGEGNYIYMTRIVKKTNPCGLNKQGKRYVGVRCPMSQCSGHLYLSENKKYGEDSYQLLDIVCDDCETIFYNGLGMQRSGAKLP